MRYGKFLAVLTAGIAVFSPVTPVLGEAEAPLKVFLQGNSSADLQALVEAQGGTVTHDLHLIDAVGA